MVKGPLEELPLAHQRRPKKMKVLIVASESFNCRQTAGLLFGVLATVRLAGLNPYAWMLDWLAACARHGGQAPSQLDPWLPWRMSQQRREQLSQAPPHWCSAQAADSASELGKAA